MTQFKINKAYGTLVRLAELKLPLKKAYELYKMTKAMEDVYQFAVSEEQKYINEFNGTINPDGTVSFEDATKFGEFQERLAALNDMEVEIDIAPVKLTEADMGDQTITPAEIFSLEGFVCFE